VRGAALQRPRHGLSALVRDLADVFDTLTYRERYEALLARTARDPVTGVLTRDRFEMAAPEALQRAQMQGAPLSVLLVDVDRFKSINDRFGHAKGDEVLRQIAQEISSQVRAGDRVFRFGGEEFVVLCEHTAHAAARLLAERLRLAVQLGSALGAAGKTTVSIGIATTRSGAVDLDSLLAVADARLYAAKAAGRDCVIGETQQHSVEETVPALRETRA
jgi:diguanylate cyclase (GGDEF)-like protein